MSAHADAAAANAIRAAFARDARTSDPGLDWLDLVAVLRIAGLGGSATDRQLRIWVGFIIRRIRKGDATSPGLPVICDPDHCYRLAIDRSDAAYWLFRTGGQAARRAGNLVAYVDTATAVHGHLNPTTGPPLWIAARAQLDAAHTTIQLAHRASFG